MVSLNHRETATVLAALRLWQETANRDETVDEERWPHFTEATPLSDDEIDTLINDKINHVDALEIDHPLTDEERNEVRCSLCRKWCNAETAHLHQDEWVGDECCWTEQLKASE